MVKSIFPTRICAPKGRTGIYKNNKQEVPKTSFQRHPNILIKPARMGADPRWFRKICRDYPERNRIRYFWNICRCLTGGSSPLAMAFLSFRWPRYIPVCNNYGIDSKNGFQLFSRSSYWLSGPLPVSKYPCGKISPIRKSRFFSWWWP